MIEDKWSGVPNSLSASSRPTTTSEPPRELYLGLLYATEQHKVKILNSTITWTLAIQNGIVSVADIGVKDSKLWGSGVGYTQKFSVRGSK